MKPRLAARTARGVLHIVTPTVRGYDTACFRTVSRRTVDVVYEGRDRWGRQQAAVAWKHERICLDCERLRSMGLPHFLAVTGWG